MAPVDVTAGDRSASEILSRNRSVFLPGLRAAVDSLPVAMRHIAGYHLGWWDAEGTHIEASGGKAIRPALTLLCAEAVGGDVEHAVPAAVAVELVHNFSLIHDDVLDGDDARRHRPTAWRVFGVGNAILAGDALLTLALDVVGEVGPLARSQVAAELAHTLCTAVQALIDGQSADVAFESRTDVDLEECMQMAEHKTGALLRCACRLGALAGAGHPDQIDHLTQFGARLGLAFQVADDLQGIWGDPRTTGKPAYSDLGNRKKSMPVVVALASGTQAGDELAAWFDRAREPTTAELERAAVLVDEAGGREWSQTKLASLQAEAEAHLAAADLTARAFAELGELARLVTGPGPTSVTERPSGSLRGDPQ